MSYDLSSHGSRLKWTFPHKHLVPEDVNEIVILVPSTENLRVTSLYIVTLVPTVRLTRKSLLHVMNPGVLDFTIARRSVHGVLVISSPRLIRGRVGQSFSCLFLTQSYCRGCKRE